MGDHNVQFKQSKRKKIILDSAAVLQGENWHKEKEFNKKKCSNELLFSFCEERQSGALSCFIGTSRTYED